MSVNPPPNQLSTSSILTKSTSNDHVTDFQIFLGGSCNPTTWRQSVAVPYLEMNGISYFNPQVDNWTPEILDSERWAKQNAKVLLFVIDKQTRSTVSLVESAFMSVENKNLVLVIYPFEYDVISLTDTSTRTSNIVETRSNFVRSTNLKRETNETSSYSKRSSTISSTLITSNKVQESINNLDSNRALSAIRAQQLSSAQRTASKSSKIDRLSECEIDQESSIKAIHEKSKETTGTIKIDGEVISLGEFNELRQARYMLQNLLALRDIPMFSDILQALDYVSNSLKEERQTNSPNLRYLSREVKTLNILDSENEFREQSNVNLGSDRELIFSDSQRSKDCMRDVYISSDIDDHTSIESNVMSILEENGLTYDYMPVNSIMDIPKHESDAAALMSEMSLDSFETRDVIREREHSSLCDIERLKKAAIQREICTIKNSRVLLFVITNKCRGLAIMVLASHFMALFRTSVVLCVQYLEEPCLISGEILTKTAIADYNRGRVYLSDYATKSQVPVFSSVREAIECCSRKCRYVNKS